MLRVNETLNFWNVSYVKALPFLAKKMFEAFAVQKLPTIIQQKVNRSWFCQYCMAWRILN